jgi:hypothetical protein
MSTPHDSDPVWTTVVPGTFRMQLSEHRALTVEPDAVPFRRFTWRIVLREDTRFEVLAEHVRDITLAMNSIASDPARYDREPRS